MKNIAKSTGLLRLLAPLITLACISNVGVAQQNAICTSTTQCLPTAKSSAFLDASVPGIIGSDFCVSVNNILTLPTYPSTGAVIDARGLNSGNTNMTCSASPWGSGSGYLNVPSTILLPATTATNPIKISSTWVLPNGTKLIGEETTDPALNTNGTAVQTTIQATSGMASGNAMIQFGDSTHCPSSICTGISVEHLTLYGNGNSLIGIQNENSQDLSYVDHVTLYHVLGPGLLVSGNAERSGPYTNIQYDTGGSGGSGPVCAQIKGLSSTHGIHGLTLGACPA